MEHKTPIVFMALTALIGALVVAGLLLVPAHPAHSVPGGTVTTLRTRLPIQGSDVRVQ